MSTGITERDKKLLYMLGMIVIAALFFIIGIRPTNRKIREIDEDIEDAQVIHDTIKMKMFQLGTIQAFKNNAEEMAVNLSSRYYDMMVPAEADKLITNKALSYGLKVNNLSIKYDTEPVIQLAYVNSEAYALQKKAMEEALLVQNAEDSTEASDEDSTDEKTKVKSSGSEMVDIEVLASINNSTGVYSVEDTSAADVYVTSMVLDVYGSRDKAQALLDDIIKNQSLRVTSFEWASMTSLPYQYVDGQLVSIAQEDGDRLIINFDMYMYNGAEFKAMAAEDKGQSNEESEGAEETDDGTDGSGVDNGEASE